MNPPKVLHWYDDVSVSPNYDLSIATMPAARSENESFSLIPDLGTATECIWTAKTRGRSFRQVTNARTMSHSTMAGTFAFAFKWSMYEYTRHALTCHDGTRFRWSPSQYTTCLLRRIVPMLSTCIMTSDLQLLFLMAAELWPELLRTQRPAFTRVVAEEEDKIDNKQKVKHSVWRHGACGPVWIDHHTFSLMFGESKTQVCAKRRCQLFLVVGIMMHCALLSKLSVASAHTNNCAGHSQVYQCTRGNWRPIITDNDCVISHLCLSFLWKFNWLL